MTAEEITQGAIERGAIQQPKEFVQLVRLVQELKPKTILEIGCDKGGTLWAWKQIAPRVIGIDLPQGPFSSGNKLVSHEAEMIIGDSHDPATLLQLPKQIDFLFIDGDHTYEGVKQDWLMYGPRGKVVAFHDIVIHDGLPQVGVHKLWQEITGNKQEFIGSGIDMGIGVWSL